MATIYDRLGFNGGDLITQAAVSPYSESANNRMNSLKTKPMIADWQAQDIADNSVSGYFVNPVGDLGIQIKNTMASINATVVGSSLSSSISQTIGALLYSSAAAATTGVVYANTFVYITNRESNVLEAGTDVTNIHYTQAMSTGKMLAYLTSQSGEIANNSTITGMFTSITLANTLTPLVANLTFYTGVLANSISTTTSGGQNPTTSNTSNISLVDAQALSDVINSLNYIVNKYPTQDNAFYANAKQVVNDFNKIKQFSNLGGSENFLLNNYIGTPKLKSRINSS